ncbi:FecCD family ABC transporter permease [Arsukibacterium perlucidum]|uniref:FecCD family ABC transporter permease n=1 Tax=Arsukibacterium perlucidum TaxID=368811 RepID=UPI00036C9B0B|nr:iron ABC transporter permease [Arsukibacterium perlucidum]
MSELSTSTLSQQDALSISPPAQLQAQLRSQLSLRARSQRRLIQGLMLLLLLVMLWSLTQGAMKIAFADVIASLLPGITAGPDGFSQQVMWDIRLPRVLLTAITGAGLAVCGAVMQGICRNPLADPGLIGVSSGAALFAAMVMVFDISHFLPALLQPVLISLAAFIGALLVSQLVFQLAHTAFGLNTLLLILAGVAINALVGTIMGLLAFIADDGTLRLITFWSMGSYAGSNWTQVLLVGLGVSAPLLLLWRYRSALTLMLGGEQDAQNLGVPVQKIKRVSLLCVALLTAVCVCFTGIVGFVGLVTPHICRLLTGPDLRSLIPLSALAGALLVTSADTLARILIIPAELPVGLVTSMLGVPFFLYLLLQYRRSPRHV